jgi:hypothetical protein
MLPTLARALASRVPATVSARRRGAKVARALSGTRAEAMNRADKIDPASPRLHVWVCDIQEKFSSAVAGFDHVAHNTSTMLRAIDAMQSGWGTRVIMTEQVPEKLGPTVASVRDAARAVAGERRHRVSKTAFSMYDVGKAFVGRNSLDGSPVRHVVVGLEAHVCVMQTVLDLLANEPNGVVYVCVDAVSSIRLEDRAVALRRMERAGAILTCTESVVFEMMGDANHPQFRAVSKIVREGATNKPTDCAPLPSI